MSRCYALNTSDIFIMIEFPATTMQYTLIEYTYLKNIYTDI